ncbi:DUF6207 family protein [Streptomyces sp. NPDC051582]|uniref:DUF6207 family protein n=1 Tax=Streptomyces sp. NPDC051582 TaxID=3155167 RepID=UPI003424AF62
MAPGSPANRSGSTAVAGLVKPFDEQHIAEPGLVFPDITGGDEDTVRAFPVPGRGARGSAASMRGTAREGWFGGPGRRCLPVCSMLSGQAAMAVGRAAVSSRALARTSSTSVVSYGRAACRSVLSRDVTRVESMRAASSRAWWAAAAPCSG